MCSTTPTLLKGDPRRSVLRRPHVPNSIRETVFLNSRSAPYQVVRGLVNVLHVAQYQWYKMRHKSVDVLRSRSHVSSRSCLCSCGGQAFWGRAASEEPTTIVVLLLSPSEYQLPLTIPLPTHHCIQTLSSIELIPDT